MVFWLVLWLALIAGLVYTVIPDVLLHRLGIGSWRRQFSQGVVLTFDDGPDPKVTPKVLDILVKYKVPAVFFLVGEQAQAHPEIVKRMLAEGHRVGLHSQSHRYAWFLSPRQTWREWEDGAKVLENLTGGAVAWMRPPWGTFNLVTWLWLKRRGKKAILWNVEGQEWKKGQSEAQVLSRLVTKANEGSIIVLHDGGRFPGERMSILPVVDALCQRIVEERKLPWAALEFPAWSLARRVSFRLWEKWEHVFARVYRVERLDAVNILRLGKTRYQGPDLYHEDGRILAKRGDVVGEIHLDSIRVQAQSRDMQKSGIQALRMARESFPVLARYIAQSPEYQTIKVFLGFTLMHRGVKGLGFTVQEIPATWGIRWIGFLQKMIMSVYHPAGKARLNGRLQGAPKLIWISKEKLLERWLPAGEGTVLAPVASVVPVGEA